ncbi:hypothetical protein QL093DRAFT_1460195 [Fusarium oxysporum]|nr:hypothetical protein QL093DRAFT_1460195 [Fusarium oxysporum]
MWYYRHEIQFRQALPFSVASVTGSFSGLLAFGTAKMDGFKTTASFKVGQIDRLAYRLPSLPGDKEGISLTKDDTYYGWVTIRSRRPVNDVFKRENGVLVSLSVGASGGIYLTRDSGGIARGKKGGHSSALMILTA